MTDKYHSKVVDLAERMQTAAYREAYRPGEERPTLGLTFDAMILVIAGLAAQHLGQARERIESDVIEDVVLDFRLTLGKTLLRYFPELVTPELAAEIERLDLETKDARGLDTPPHGSG